MPLRDESSKQTAGEALVECTTRTPAASRPTAISQWATGRGAPWLLAAIVLLAAVLRIHDLTRGDIWIDEANTILTAGRPLSRLLALLQLDSSPPAYYFALHCWMALFGDGETAVRALSAIGGIVLVALTGRVGSRWLSPAVGLWAALFVAASPTQIFFSQEARMYTWLPVMALASVWWLVRYLESNCAVYLAACLGAAVAALYTHNFALHLLLVLAAVVASSGELLRRWPAWTASVLAVGVLYAPWVPTLLRQSRNADHYAWFLPVWKGFGPWGAVWKTIRSFSPAGEYVMFDYKGAIDSHGVPAIGLFALAALGLWVLVRRRAELGRVGTAWVPALLLVPIGSSIAASWFATPHFVPGRVDQMVYPAYALLAATGVTALRPALARPLVGVAVLVLCVWNKSAFYTDYREYGLKGADRALSEGVRRHIEPDDVILCTSLTRASLEYYLRDDGVQLLSYPRETAEHLGAQNDLPWLADRTNLIREARAVLDMARAAAGPDGRLFLVFSRRYVNEALSPASLERNFGIREIRGLGLFAEAGTENEIRLSINQLRRSM